MEYLVGCQSGNQVAVVGSLILKQVVEATEQVVFPKSFDLALIHPKFFLYFFLSLPAKLFKDVSSFVLGLLRFKLSAGISAGSSICTILILLL